MQEKQVSKRVLYFEGAVQDIFLKYQALDNENNLLRKKILELEKQLEQNKNKDKKKTD